MNTPGVTPAAVIECEGPRYVAGVKSGPCLTQRLRRHQLEPCVKLAQIMQSDEKQYPSAKSHLLKLAHHECGNKPLPQDRTLIPPRSCNRRNVQTVINQWMPLRLSRILWIRLTPILEVVFTHPTQPITWQRLCFPQPLHLLHRGAPPIPRTALSPHPIVMRDGHEFMQFPMRHRTPLPEPDVISPRLLAAPVGLSRTPAAALRPENRSPCGETSEAAIP